MKQTLWQKIRFPLNKSGGGKYWLLLAGLIILVGRQPAMAAPLAAPNGITLSYFRLLPQTDAVVVSWGTASEPDTAGFLIQRASSAAGAYSDPGIEFIEAEGDALSGSDYTATDSSAVSGQTYWYRLIEVETDGSQNTFGPLSVQAGATPTPTPAIIATTPGESPTAAPTSTDIPTITPTPVTPTVTPTLAATLPPPTETAEATVTATRTPISISGNPTATPFQFPTATTSVVLPPATTVAQAEASPTLAPGIVPITLPPPEAYPGLPTPSFDTGNGPAYPVQEPAVTPGGQFPVPQATNEITQPGSDSGSLPPLPGAEGETVSESSQASRGRLFLWGGFCAALGVFLAGVYGSILFFSRRNQR